MDRLLEKSLAKSLSNHEIDAALDGKARILTYNELTRYNTIEQAMGPNKALVLLYETKDNNGHWICIYETTDKLIHFFDSYALPPDDELYFVDIDYRKRRNMYFPHLSQLLLDAKHKIEYNHHPFQKLSPRINTCGRWCIVRLWFCHLSLKEFIRLFKTDRNITGDAFVSLLTSDI